MTQKPSRLGWLFLFLYILTAVMKMDSIWQKGVSIPAFPRLKEDIRTDVLVVGGGLAGLLCAYELTQVGVDCALIEENQIMQGVSGRTTAKLTSQHGLIYDKLLQTLGKERAKQYFRANQEALSAFRQLAEGANCDFTPQSNYIYQTDGAEKLEKEMAAYEKLGIPYSWEKKLPLPFPVSGALKFENQGQFHPLKFAAHIARDLKIYENTKALAFGDNWVETPNGKITAEKMIIATHFPLINKHGAYFLKLYQQRSYVIALENAASLEGMYLDCAENGLSLRSAGQWLLLGGGGHRTGKQGMGWDLPERAAKKYYPDAKIATRWATQDCMTLDAMPYIGQYSKGTPNLYVATGFQKWGMTTSMLAAKLLTDLVQNRENPYESLLSPARSMLHKQLFLNGVESIANLLRPTKPRCPHLGCALHWNAAEHSWDCPCHGSRFDAEGKVLNNPATDDLQHPPEPE